MEPINIEIYKGFKQIGMLPGEFMDKTELREEHLLLSDSYEIKPGYTIVANKREKLYVTDVRLHRAYDSNKKVEVYYEIEGEHKRRTSAEKKSSLSLIISLLSLAVSIIALIKSFLS